MRYYLSVILLITGSLFAQQSRIFPQPAQLTVFPEVFHFSGVLKLEETPATKQVIAYLHPLFEAEKEVHVELTTASNPMITLHQNEDFAAESYLLEVNQQGIHIDFADQNGLLYAFQSLLQWMENDHTINGVRIMDQPRFAYRGTHLDCSRHFYTISELEQFIDEMARLKLNRFHWHLTDDQGWRLEIKQFPQLTEVGAWRDSTLEGHYSKIPRTYNHERYGGFYTQEQAKQLVAYAQARGIIIIPEIELPGHARAALAAYPYLGCTGAQLPVPGLWGVFDDVFCSKPETLDFLKKVLDEVIAVFPSETIHIGGDEVPKVRWDACARCAAQRSLHGLKDSHELQSYVIQQMAEHLASKGRKIIGWDEILEGGLTAHAQVMSWRGTEGGIAAAKAGHSVVMTPTSHCYFDYYQSGHPDEPLAIGGFLPLEKVYAYEPVPVEMTAAEAGFILGAQANIWTEYLPTMQAVYYHTYPRLIAMAQVLWTTEKPSYESFVQEMTRWYLPHLERQYIRYSTAFLDPALEWKAVPNGFELTAKAALPGVVTKYGDSELGVLELERTAEKRTLMVPVTAWYQGKALRTTNYQFTTHLALGKTVAFTTPPHEKYNHHDRLGLTDGIVGTFPWKGDQWLGFTNDTVQFTLDLDVVTAFTELSFTALNDPGSWIYRPKTMVVETSRNGKKFKPIAQSAITTDHVVLKKATKARYVRVTLVNDAQIPAGMPGAGYTPWTFLDELILTR